MRLEAAGKIVERENLLALRQQALDQVDPDKSGAAGDDMDAHRARGLMSVRGVGVPLLHQRAHHDMAEHRVYVFGELHVVDPGPDDMPGDVLQPAAGETDEREGLAADV